MPKFTYEIKQGQLLYDDPMERTKFLSGKDDGFRGYESHHKPKQSKTNLQLGYYWGLLLPEILKQMTADGWTKTLGRGRVELEVKYTEDDAHEWLKDVASKVGDNGHNVTLSEQDMAMCGKYIDNVLWIAEKWFKMNRVNLEAKRP